MIPCFEDDDDRAYRRYVEMHRPPDQETTDGSELLELRETVQGARGARAGGVPGGEELSPP